MRFKETIAALLACLALGAVAAGSAQAEGTCWTIGSPGACLSGSETVHIEKHSGSALSLTAEPFGSKLTLNATGVHCATGATCTIDDTVSPNHSSERLEFTGVTVAEPASCTAHTPGAPNGTVVTNTLTDTVTTNGSAVFDEFFTHEEPWVIIEFTGSTCSLAELEIPLEGSLTGRAVHGTADTPSLAGELFVTQSLLFNKAEQETGGGFLTMGGRPALLDATVDNTLSGSAAGKVWGSDIPESELPESELSPCWTIEGVCLSGSETVHIEKHSGSALTLTANLLSRALTLNAGEVHCAAGEACKIDDTAGPNHSEGELEFTEVTVAEPANCTVHSIGAANGTVRTFPLTDTVIMDGEAVFDEFFPETGTAFVELEFTGSKCVFNELAVPVEGTVTGRAVHGTNDTPSKTGELFVTQSLLFNKAEQETGGGLLYLAENPAKPAFLDGTVDNTLSGAHLGAGWGSDGPESELPSGWTIQGARLAAGKSETVHIEKHTGSALTLTANLLSRALTLNATGVHCATTATCTIDDTVSPNHSAGALEFTEVMVAEPANCTVHSVGAANGTVVTEPLTDTVIMDGEAVFDEFVPEAGTALAELEFTGSKCVFNELWAPVEGTLTGRAVHGTNDTPSLTGELFTTQSLLFNKAEQETGGGTLYLAENPAKPAFLDGTVDNTLSGAHIGAGWGSD